MYKAFIISIMFPFNVVKTVLALLTGFIEKLSLIFGSLIYFV